MTSYVVLLRAMGDCVISFGLLQNVRPSAGLKVVGTQLAGRVAAALPFTQHPFESVLALSGGGRRADDVAAFFDLKQSGVRRAMADLRTVRAALRGLLRPGDRVLLEHADWRNRFVVPGGNGVAMLAPPRGASIYADRLWLFRSAFGDLPDLRPCRRPGSRPRTMAVNPGARQDFKRLPPRVVENLVRHAHARGIAVHLLDPAGHHAAVAGQVERYIAHPPLPAALEVLREADLYVGSDSFFLHLAYYLDKPLFAIVPVELPYFAPPGLAAAGGLLTLARAADERALAAALDAFCARADGHG